MTGTVLEALLGGEIAHETQGSTKGQAGERLDLFLRKSKRPDEGLDSSPKQ